MSERVEELAVAIAAVRSASRVCRRVQQGLVGSDTLQKRDKSPVTVADFAAQALVCKRLFDAFPGDHVVGEEDASELRRAANAQLRDGVVELVNDELDGRDTTHEVLAWIDRGGHDADSDRYWTLDPIDGTKGFLRGEQYAVALGLIERGEVVLGVLGCPNLAGSDGSVGTLFHAEAGGEARALPIWDETARGEPIRVRAIESAAEARFCESVESGHSNQDESAQIAELLGIRSEPFRIDSQCKYAAVARGDASIYLRMPTRADYREKVWDHAAGKLLVESAGGRVSDIHGIPLDFGRGRTLGVNRGVVATSGAIHAEVIAAIRRVRGD